MNTPKEKCIFGLQNAVAFIFYVFLNFLWQKKENCDLLLRLEADFDLEAQIRNCVKKSFYVGKKDRYEVRKFVLHKLIP